MKGSENPKAEETAAPEHNAGEAGLEYCVACRSVSQLLIALANQATPLSTQSSKPFRKRRPALFWSIIILLCMFSMATLRSFNFENFSFRPDTIAIVNIDGMISDADPILKWIETVRRNPSFKAAVIRINSPGGSVAPSQEIYHAIRRLSSVKPVAVSMGDMAASGGYYAAVGADMIFASPSTITGSIGVRLEIPNFQRLLDMVGVSAKTLTTGQLKDAGSYTRPMTAAEEKYFQELINDMYETFIAVVAEGRNLPLETVRSLADGRALTGKQALEAKLVDKFGDLEDTIQYVAEKASIPGDQVKTVTGPKKEKKWLNSIFGALRDVEDEYQSRQQQPRFIF